MPDVADRLRTIEDPALRAEVAAAVLAKAETRADVARRLRNGAASALLAHGESWDTVAALIRVSRGHLREVQACEPSRDGPRAARRKARGYTERTIHALAESATARQIRDEAARAMHERGDRPVDIARACGISTARVAKMGLKVSAR